MSQEDPQWYEPWYGASKGKILTPSGNTLEQDIANQKAADAYNAGAAGGAYQLNPANPNYVGQTAVDIRQTGEAAAGNINQQAQNSANFGLHGAQRLQGLGTQAMNDLGAYGLEQGADLQQLGQKAAGKISQAGWGGAQELYGSASAAAANQAAAMGRAAPVAQFGAQNASLGGVAGLGGQLAGLEAQQGPSAAQAQLQAGLNQAQQSNLALARSGRGWGGSASALSQAAVQNAMAGQNAANASAQLAAAENAQWRQRQAANLGAAGQLGLNVAGQQGQQAQFGANLAQQQMSLNDQTGLAYGQQQLAANQAAGQMGLEGAIQAGQLGANTFGQGAALGLQGMESGYGMNIGAQQAGSQLALQGAGQAGALYGAGAQQQLGAIGMENQIYQQQANLQRAGIQDMLTRYGIDQGVAVNQQAMDNQMIGAGLSAAGSMLPLLLAASDRDVKQGIKPAEAIELPLVPTSGPSGPRQSPIESGTGALAASMSAPGGAAYDKAMGSAARAARLNPSAQEGNNLIEVNPLSLDKNKRIAYQATGNMMGLAGSLAGRGGAGNPYMFNPYAQQYLASDKNSKMRIAQLEDQVVNMGGNPDESANAMPLVYDPRDKIYRPYDPEFESQGGFQRNEGGGPFDVPDPLGYGSIAALDEAQVRQGGQVMMPSPQQAAQTIEKAPAYSFEYKDPARHGAGRYVGPMAQNLESTPAGRSVVNEAPDGTKMVDTSRLSLLNTAALHQMQERLDRIEGDGPSDDEVRRRVVKSGDRIVGAPEIFNRYQAQPDIAALDDAYAREQAYRGFF